MTETTEHEQTLLSFFAPVRSFLDDPAVSEIMINGPHQIYIDRGGCLELTEASFGNVELLTAALRNLSRRSGAPGDLKYPVLEGRLPDGSRVEALLPPASPDGPTVRIRRIAREPLNMDRLVSLDALTPLAAQTLAALVAGKVNILVAGASGSGKTSMLNALTGLVPEGERMVVIQESREVKPQRRHLVHLETRRSDAQKHGEITMRELLRAALRMRPDRVVVGDIRGGEALEVIQAMITGQGGCMGTLHAHYLKDTLPHLETMIMMSDSGLPQAVIRAQAATAVQLIVQMARLQDGARKVTHISEVAGYDIDRQAYRVRDLFARDGFGADTQNRSVSALRPCGVLPTVASQLAERGVSLPREFIAAADAIPEDAISSPHRAAVVPVFIGEWKDRHFTYGLVDSSDEPSAAK